MSLNKKRITVGIIMAIVMSPFMLAGLLFQCVKAYFESGQQLAGIAVEYLDDWLG